LAQLHPKEALHHSQLARALLSGGLAEAARIEARHAALVEPTSAWAHVTLGWVLQHDAIGRFHRRGWDRAGAIAAYRKAKELDPEDAGVRVDLARVFEHDVDGERYAAGAQLAEAIAEYRALRKDTGNRNFDEDLLRALLSAERWKEARELARDL